MITEKNYTDNGDHPEDVIYRVKNFVRELANVQDYYFNNLMLSLNLKDEVNDYLFDYVFNEKDYDGFEEYLETLGRKYEDFLEDK